MQIKKIIKIFLIPLFCCLALLLIFISKRYIGTNNLVINNSSVYFDNGSLTLTSYSSSTSDVNITTTITPSSLSDYGVSWTFSWTNSTITDALSDYISTSESDDTLTLSISVNDFFENQITITSTCNYDASYSATTTLDTAQRLNGSINDLDPIDYEIVEIRDYDDSGSYSVEPITSIKDEDNDVVLYDDGRAQSAYATNTLLADYSYTGLSDEFDSDVILTGNDISWSLDLNHDSSTDNEIIDFSFEFSNFNEFMEDNIDLSGTVDSTLSCTTELVPTDALETAADTYGFTVSSRGSGDGQLNSIFTSIFGTSDFDDNSDLSDMLNSIDSDDAWLDLEVIGTITYDSNTVETFTIDYPIVDLYYTEC